MRKLIYIGCLALLTGACTPTRAFSTQVRIVAGPTSPGFDRETTMVLGNRGTIEVTNSLDKDHGFSIAELGVEKLIKPGETVRINVKDVKPVDYEYFCQLHDVKTAKGKHNRGTLRVAP